MHFHDIPYTPITNWDHKTQDLRSTFIPQSIALEMMSDTYKPQRSTGWITHKQTGIPVKLTIVSPWSKKGINKETIQKWYYATDLILSTIDEMCGDSPERPCSLDILIYQSNEKKTLKNNQDKILPKNANTGLMTRDTKTGKVQITIFRIEECLKTLAHELLHSYMYSDWLNVDDDIQHICYDCCNSLGISIDQRLKPTEAMVDCMAIKLIDNLFCGSSWEECRKFAFKKASELYSIANNKSKWKQHTAAFEYYCLKPLMMERIDDILVFHSSSGLQKPDKNKIRRLFLNFPIDIRKILLQSTKNTKKTISLRMTPKTLPEKPVIKN
ncbi:hypothetical protein TetV_203 [Tetraselmis virus 1]|uniref:Uncharacterized protein n=1 Tax=Tetraselmis virus 1 TaxID=2060617 RepID=A0A2P0VN05_9VIRU|nr:hypothetical protein QJ968_gp203 [Tetraselmis virus 1]AUF82295.1 hypothetical protein TetV_203 [Tetraselmis virus 1]